MITSVLIKSCSPSEDLSVYKMLRSHVDWSRFYTHLSSLRIPLSPYSTGSLNKIIIQVKPVGTPMVFHCKRLRLSEWNGSWLAARIQNVNFGFQQPPCSLSIAKATSLKVVHPLKICQNIKFHGPRLAGGRSQWPRGLMRRSAAAWLLGSWVRIPLGAWMFVSCVYTFCCSVQIEASVTGWSLVQESPTVCLNICVITETPKGALCSSWELEKNDELMMSWNPLHATKTLG